MAYSIGEKTYDFKISLSGSIILLIPMIIKAYQDMCEYHGRKIIDKNHIKNYIRATLGYTLSKADIDFVYDILMKGNLKTKKEEYLLIVHEELKKLYEKKIEKSTLNNPDSQGV